MKAAVSVDALKQDLLLQKASKLVVDEAKVGEAPKKEEAAAEEKPKKATQEDHSQEEDRGGRRRGAARRGEAQAHPEEEDRGERWTVDPGRLRPPRVDSHPGSGEKSSHFPETWNHVPVRRAYFGITV